MQTDVSSRTESSRFCLRDKEKRTAINVAYMYEYLTEREWFGTRHMGENGFINYLSDSAFRPKDADVNTLLNARDDGVHLAKLHVCSTVSQVFGRLSKQEELYVYGKHKPARQSWTTRHAFASMFSLNPDKRKVRGSNIGRLSKVTALRQMNRRNRQILSTKDLLHKVKDDPETTLDRRREASDLLTELEQHVHMQTSRAYCFRLDLSENIGYLKRYPRFIPHLQSKLLEMGIIGTEDSFVSGKPLLSLAPFRVIHVDVTQRALFTPGFSIENMTIGNLLRHKAKSSIERNVSTVDMERLLAFHVHVDNAELIPLPKSKFYRETMRCFIGNDNQRARKIEGDVDVDCTA